MKSSHPQGEIGRLEGKDNGCEKCWNFRSLEQDSNNKIFFMKWNIEKIKNSSHVSSLLLNSSPEKVCQHIFYLSCFWQPSESDWAVSSMCSPMVPHFEMKNINIFYLIRSCMCAIDSKCICQLMWLQYLLFIWLLWLGQKLFNFTHLNTAFRWPGAWKRWSPQGSGKLRGCMVMHHCSPNHSNKDHIMGTDLAVCCHHQVQMMTTPERLPNTVASLCHFFIQDVFLELFLATFRIRLGSIFYVFSHLAIFSKEKH